MSVGTSTQWNPNPASATKIQTPQTLFCLTTPWGTQIAQLRYKSRKILVHREHDVVKAVLKSNDLNSPSQMAFADVIEAINQNWSLVCRAAAPRYSKMFLLDVNQMPASRFHQRPWQHFGSQNSKATITKPNQPTHLLTTNEHTQQQPTVSLQYMDKIPSRPRMCLVFPKGS